MHDKKITIKKPFILISNIRELEEKLVNQQMISKMHDSAKLTEQVRLMIALLDVSRKYNLLGYSAMAVRTYIRVIKMYSMLVK